MKTSDEIVVLLCSFQGERFIAEQIESIIFQTYPHVSIRVYDDCSTDKTREIVKGLCAKYKHITLYENAHKLGFLKNFEQAIRSLVDTTATQYIALADQDDIWHKDKLSISMAALKSLEVKQPETPVLVHSDLSLIDDSGRALHASFFKKKAIVLPEKKSLSKISGHCGVMGNTILMNRFLVQKALPFPDGLKYHDYWLALINELLGARATLKQTLIQYRIHDENISNNNQSNAQSESMLGRDYKLPFMEDQRELAISYVLETYSLSQKDRELLTRFNQFLLFRGNRVSQYLFLIRCGFLKQGFAYRASVFFRLLFTKRYSH